MASADRAHPMIVVQFPFAGGIDEASRDEIVEPGGGWPVLENGRQDHRGGYSTRNGFAALSTSRLDTTTSTQGLKVFADRNGIVRITEALTAEAYSVQAGAWNDLGRVCELMCSTTEIPNPGSSSTPEDVEYCNGYLATTVADVSNHLTGHVTILDAASKTVVLSPVSFGISFVASFSSRYFIVLSAHAEDFSVYILDTLTAASVNTGWTLLATVGADWSTGTPIALCSLTDRIAIAYMPNTGGTDQLAVKTYNQTGLLESATVNTSSASPGAIDIRGDLGGTLWLAWSEATAVKMCGLTYNSLATVLATTATIMTMATAPAGLLSISPSSTTAGRLIVNDGDETDIRMHMRGYQTTLGVAATLGSQITVYNALHCSRPFFYGTRHYVLMFGACTSSLVNYGNEQKVMILADWTEDLTVLRPVANITPGLAVSSYYGKAKTVVGADTSVLYSVAGVTRTTSNDAATLLAYDFGSLARWEVAAFGNSTFIPGAMLSYFDGSRCAEVGFLYRPVKPVLSSLATGITGTFRYIAVYEEVDADGNWHVSGLSTPSDTITVANKEVTATTRPLTCTQRAVSTTSTVLGVRVGWYRTLDGGVAPYYRVGVSAIDTATSSTTFSDQVTDAVLATKAKLYSQPLVLGTSQDHRPPPGLGLIVAYGGMLVGAVGSDVWFSAQNISGEGVWFNPVFQVPIPGEGDITALYVMDGTLFVCKQRDVYALSGDAPADNGAGGLGSPRRLSADVGAVSHVTCSSALGTFLQSDRGIEIMGRSQNVEWIGEAVQDTLADYPIVTSMTVDPRSCTVLIELAAAESNGLANGSGRTLVYDLSLRTWVSTDRRASYVGLADVPAQSACMVYTGTAWRYAWLGIDGTVYTETDEHLDGVTWIAKRAVSGHVKVSGIQGYQHVNKALFLAKRHTSHDLSLAFAYDYGDFKAAQLYTASLLDDLASQLPNVQLEHGMHDDARCESVRIEITDATPSTGETVGTGQAATWIALAFEVVQQQGAYLLPDEAK